MMHVSLVCAVLCCTASSVVGQYRTIQNGDLTQILQNQMFTSQQPQRTQSFQGQFPNASRNLKILLLGSRLLGSSQLGSYSRRFNNAQTLLPRNTERNMQRDRFLPRNTERNIQRDRFLPTNTERNIQRDRFLPTNTERNIQRDRFLPTNTERNMQRDRFFPTNTERNMQRDRFLPRNTERNIQRDRFFLSSPGILRSTSQIPMSGMQMFPHSIQHEPQSNAMMYDVQYYAPPSSKTGHFSTMYPKKKTRQVNHKASRLLRQSSSPIPGTPKMSSSSIFSSSPPFSGSEIGMNPLQSLNNQQPITTILNTQTRHTLMSSRTQGAPSMATKNRFTTGTPGQSTILNAMSLLPTRPGLVRSASSTLLPSVQSSRNTVDRVGSSFQNGETYGQGPLTQAIAKLYMYPRLQQLLYVRSRRRNTIMPPAKSMSVNAQNAVTRLNPGAQQTLGGRKMTLGNLYVQHQLSNNVFQGSNMFRPQVGTLLNPSFLMPNGGIVSKVSGGETEVISADGRRGKLEGGQITFEKLV